VLALLVGAVAVGVSGLILPGVEVKTFLGALEAAALIAVFNAIAPPLVAALRLPLTLVLGFLAVLIVDALVLMLVSDLAPNDFKVDSFGWALRRGHGSSRVRCRALRKACRLIVRADAELVVANEARDVGQPASHGS